MFNSSASLDLMLSEEGITFSYNIQTKTLMALINLCEYHIGDAQISIVQHISGCLQIHFPSGNKIYYDGIHSL